ncbi:MAG: DUF6326 family protein [Acidimicrobiales bacterium]
MTTHTTTQDSGQGQLADCTVNVRVKISALWAAMLFIFAYVDLFALYRPDFRADLAEDKISVFTVNEAFLLFATGYITVASLMVFLTVVLRPRIARMSNMIISVLYVLTIVPSAIGEWYYFILGSILEVGLLGMIFYYAWSWPKQAAQA